jgi:hypothetical protein
MRLTTTSIKSRLPEVSGKMFSRLGIQRDSEIKMPANPQPETGYLVMWAFMLLLFLGITGCGSNMNTPPPTESASLLPARLAEAMPSSPQDPEQMVKALQQVFKKWALAGNLQDSPDVLAGFYNLLMLSDLDPTEKMQSWLTEAQAQANGQEATDLAALETDLADDFQPLSLDESFFYLWQHGQENPDAATDAGVRLALIAAIGDENLQREVVRAWRQLTE